MLKVSELCLPTTDNFTEGSIEVTANAGDAVLFWDFTPEGKPDDLSLHGAKPVIKGTKWAMTKWIREKPTEYSWRSHLAPGELAALDAEEVEWLKNRS